MPPHERFTTNLLETLASSRLKLIDYVERKKSEVDKDVEEYHKTLAQEEEQIQAQKETLKAVQSERGLSSEEGITQRREQLSVNKTLLEERVRTLQEEARKQELTVEELREEERLCRIKAEEAMDHKARVEESKNTTVDDLTRGIINYKYLGFDFVKAKGNGLRFSFTQLDAGDPKRCFSFVLTANADDVYEVDECRDLDEDTLDRLVKQLNESDDLSAFMLGMRRAFSATV
ncbi:Chromosome segregation protein Spc25 [Fragilaria crotonensis]|nr:Chromosome segregation protein Spc25 [Fragilaria crotonensis]